MGGGKFPESQIKFEGRFAKVNLIKSIQRIDAHQILFAIPTLPTFFNNLNRTLMKLVN
jgi:hypothetical protein